MPIGMIIMRWDFRTSTEILIKYPDEINISDETLMQIYAAHEYSGDTGMISLMVGHLNIASYYTGGENSIYVILILSIEEDADSFESGLSDISRVILNNYESEAYLEMTPFLFRRLSTYPYLNLEQTLAIKYNDEINRMIINRLQNEGVVSKSELAIWLKDKYRGFVFNIDVILIELIKKEILKEASVKGMPSEILFLINDIFMIRRPPIKLIQNPIEMGLPEQFLEDYKIEIKDFFKDYRPSEEDNLRVLELIIDPQVYEILKLLRTAIVTKNVLLKLKKKGVDDLDEGLKKLWNNKMIQIFQRKDKIEYYALISDFTISLIYPKYILNTIISQYDVKSKSHGVLIEYLNVLENSYRPSKVKTKNK